MWENNMSESYELPCGYVDASGKVHKTVELKGMSGFEDEIMDTLDLTVTDKISKVLSESITKLGDITDKKVIEAAISDKLPNTELPLTAQDRLASVLFLRRKTLGDFYYFEKKCPKCNFLNENQKKDLKTLNIKAVQAPNKRKVKVTLPKSKKVAVLKVVTATTEEQISKLKFDLKDVKTLAILARLDSLDGVTIKNDDTTLDQNIALLKALPTPDRLYLMNVYRLMEGDIDTNVTIRCGGKECGKTLEFPLDLNDLFNLSKDEKPKLEDLVWI